MVKMYTKKEQGIINAAVNQYKFQYALDHTESDNKAIERILNLSAMFMQ